MTEFKKQSKTPQLWATFILYMKCKPNKESKRVRFIVNFIICDLQSLKRCGLTFLHWKGKKKKCTGKLSKTSKVIISPFFVYLAHPWKFWPQLDSKYASFAFVVSE